MERAACIVGACLQGALLGVLLALAVLQLLQVAPGSYVFRYQGY